MPAFGATRGAGRLSISPRLASGLLLVLVGWLVFWFSSTDTFYIRHLEVEGGWRLQEAELLRVSGLDGVNIFWADTGAAERALKALPEVESARVRCWLPAHCSVHLKERSAMLVWRQGEAQIWIGADGVALPARGELPNALVLDAAGGTALKPGERLPASLLAAVHQLEQLQPDVRVYQYSDQFGLGFTSRYGWPVRLGHDGDIAQKLALLEAISDRLVAQGVTPSYIDVRFPEAPYYGK